MEPGTKFILRLFSAVILWLFLMFLAYGCTVNIYRKPCNCPDTVYITLPRPMPEFEWNLEGLPEIIKPSWHGYKVEPIDDILDGARRRTDSLLYFEIKKLTTY